ncbi:MAG: C-type lectin domain-containing protein [Alphaproteobacteria bacterium]|nr:C-type lectin domain-containing protein [Alphaproteobacteria bacterium]
MLLALATALANGDGTPEACNGIDDDRDGLVDEEAVCTGCRQASFEGRSYLFCEAEFDTQDFAAQTCAGFGYHLVDVQDEAEHDWLVTELSLLRAYWTGLTDAQPNSYRWSDGSDATYIPWGPAQPDDLTGTENCAWYFAGSGAQEHGLNDVPCTAGGAAAICESADTEFVCETGDTAPPDTDVPVVVPDPPGHVICGCDAAAGPSPWGFWALARRR